MDLEHTTNILKPDYSSENGHRIAKEKTTTLRKNKDLLLYGERTSITNLDASAKTH